MTRWAVKNVQRFFDGGIRDLSPSRQPFFVLQMSKFFSHGDVNELIERNALTLRDMLRHFPDGWHKSKRKFTHDNLLLACWHLLTPSF